MPIPARLRTNVRIIAFQLTALLVAILLVGCTGPIDQAPASGSSAAPETAAGGFLEVSGFATDPPVEWRDGTVPLAALPPEAFDTLELVATDGPYPYDQDGSTFFNREGFLPSHPSGYYEEFTVETPGLSHRGPRRLVLGDGIEVYYTDDHYESFRFVVP